MDPITWTAIALALVNGAGGKVGEKISEGAISSARRLFSLLSVRAPQTAKRLSAISQSDDELDIIDAETIEEVKQAVENDAEMQAIATEISGAMQQQFSGVTNQQQLAKKIGILIQGNNNPIHIENFHSY